MENRTDDRKRLRNRRYSLLPNIALTIIIVMGNLIACSPEVMVNEEEEPPRIVEDWPEPKDTITIKVDSVWDATREDSIRLGLLPPD